MKAVHLLHITDIEIIIDNVAVGGVFDFTVNIDGKQTQAYEILSAEPWAVIGKEKVHLITLVQYTNSFVPFGDKFSIELKSKLQTIEFSDCSVKSISTTVNEAENIVTTTVILAGGAKII